MYKGLEKILFTLVMAFYVTTLNAQPYSASKVEGLPKAEYYNCVQDEQGYMLFATDIGLVRWDGRNAVVYDVKNGLPGNSVLFVEKVNKGLMFFIRGHGMYNYYNGKVKEYKINKKIGLIKREHYLPTFITDNTSIFINFDTVLIKTSDDILNDKYYKLLTTNPSRNLDSIKKFFFKFHGKTASMRGYFNETNKIREFAKTEVFIPKERTNYMHISPIIWRKRVNHDILEKGKIRKITKERIQFCSSDNSGFIVSMHNTGLVRVDNNLKFKIFVKFKKPIYSYYINSSKNILLCCGPEGVYQTNNANVSFIEYPGITMLKSIDSSVFIANQSGEVSFCKDDLNCQKILQSSTNTFDICSHKNNYITSSSFYINNKKTRSTQIFEQGKALFLFNDKNKIHYGVMNAIGTYSISTKKPISSKRIDATYGEIAVRNCLRVSNNLALIGRTKGMVLYDVEKRKFKGTKKFDKLKNEYIVFLDTIKGVPIIGNRLNIHAYMNDSLVKMMELDSGKLLSITSFAKFGNLALVGTTNGCLIYNIKNKWTLQGHIGSVVFGSNKILHITQTHKKIFFATDRGVHIITKKSILKFKNALSNIHLSRVFKSKAEISHVKFPQIKDNEFLRLVLNMVDLQQINPAMHYKYRTIEQGVKKNGGWIETDNPEIIAANLPHGKYVIEIKPMIFGLKNPNEIIRYSFEVVAPFYRRQSFFWMLGIVFLALMLYGIWAQVSIYRTKSKLAKTQISLLRGALNPHMIFNSLNTLQSLFVSNRGQEASEQITHFTKFLRYNLDHHSSNTVPLGEELINLESYLELEKARHDGSFSYSISNSLTDYELSIPFPALILQPIAENTIVHGINSKILKLHLICYRKEKNIVIELTDNGGGIKDLRKSKKEKHGLDIINELASLYNKSKVGTMLIEQKNVTKNSEFGLMSKITILQ